MAGRASVWFTVRLLAIPCLLVSLIIPVILSCSNRNRIENYLYYRLNANPSTLDPAHIVDVTGGLIAAKLFNGLVRLDGHLGIIPDIASHWNVSKDGLTYTFFLKRGVRFSNGREVRARDFRYSFMRVLDSKTHSPVSWVLEKIKGAGAFTEERATYLEGIRIRDDYCLEISLSRPFSPFLSLLTMTTAYVVPEEEVGKWGTDFSFHPVGTGPFSIGAWLPNRELRLERREDYFDKKAKVKGIIYRVIPEDLATMTEFEIGNLDEITIPASGISRYRNDARWRDLTFTLKGINTYYIGMNCSRPPFDNPEIRRAMNMAIDREKILATFYEKRGRLAAGPVPDELRRWHIGPAYEYNPEKAREIVAREGLRAAAVRFYVTADQEVVDMAEIIQSYLEKAGLRVTITQLEWSAYKEAINRGEPDMFWLSWWADYPDPEDFLFPLFHSSNIGPAGNRARYRNQEVDRLIELGQASMDEKTAASNYGMAERLIIHDAPWVFFWHKTDFILRQPWVIKGEVYPIYSMDKGTEVSLK
jgi:oligopeptide transport system substrate-binding protein